MDGAAQRIVPHVAFVDGNCDSIYGGQRRMLVLATALSSAFRTTIVTTGEGRLADAARSAGLAVEVLSAHASINRFGGAIARASVLDRGRVGRHVLGWSLRFARWARSQGVEVTVANDLRSVLTCSIGAHTIRVPIVWSVRDDVRNGRFHALAALAATRVVTVSEAAKRVFTDRERRRLGHRLCTIHNGIPFEAAGSLDGTRLRSVLGSGVGRAMPTIALVGMVTPRKGHHEALIALARLRDVHRTPAHLAIIGDAPDGYGDYQADLRSSIDELGLATSVSWLGYRSDAVELMCGADLVILPSRNEGLPGVLIEALAVGTPVVTYACSGADEIVRDGVTGAIVPIGDHEALAAAIAEWLGEPERRARAGALGAEEMRRRFSVDAYARAYRALIEELAGRAPRLARGAA